jgi:hypothetical protein
MPPSIHSLMCVVYSALHQMGIIPFSLHRTRYISKRNFLHPLFTFLLIVFKRKYMAEDTKGVWWVSFSAIALYHFEIGERDASSKPKFKGREQPRRYFCFFKTRKIDTCVRYTGAFVLQAAI